jgi:hypothetical protein
LQSHKIILGLILVLGLVILPVSASASTAVVKATSSSSKVNLGGSVTVTVTVSGSAAIGSWQYNLVYDTAKLKLTSSNNSTFIVDYGNGTKKSASYTYTFKTIALGNASVSIKNAAVIDYNTVNEMSVSTYGCTINIANFSSVNTLSSLSITDGTISPAFDPQTTEYMASVANTVNSVTISAAPTDSKSSVAGTGTFNVVEGENKFPIVVTAENGSVKTYTLTVEVSELNPIKVTLDSKEYTVVRKSGKVTTPIGYTETTVLINENEIVAYKSDITNLTLVVLKDTDGKFILATYNADKNEYSLYTQLSSSDIIIYLMEPAKNVNIPLGYKKVKVKINDIEVNAWNLPDNKNKGLYIIYGMNVETGDKGFYQYDNIEETFQRFSNDQVVDLNKELDQTKMILYITLGSIALILFIALIFLIVMLSKKNKLNKKQKSHKSSAEEYLEKTIDIEKELKNGKKKK